MRKPFSVGIATQPSSAMRRAVWSLMSVKAEIKFVQNPQLNRLLAEKKGAITTITTDMWKAYITTAQELFPEASLIHDRVHLIQYLNKGIDQIRRREVKQHKELKNSRYALLKNEENRTKTQDEIFKLIQEANLQVSVAWRLREDFKAIFECKPFSDAKQYFYYWFESVKEAAVNEILQVAQMFERHLTGVCSALCHEQSNARVQRINEQYGDSVPPLSDGLRARVGNSSI